MTATPDEIAEARDAVTFGMMEFFGGDVGSDLLEAYLDALGVPEMEWAEGLNDRIHDRARLLAQIDVTSLLLEVTVARLRELEETPDPTPLDSGTDLDDE